MGYMELGSSPVSLSIVDRTTVPRLWMTFLPCLILN